MSVVRLVLFAVLTTTLATPLASQGIPRGARLSQQANTGPRLMVANPFAFSAGDSAAAVQIGTAAREQLKERFGQDYSVVEQEQMNEALVQYGYPRDAILSPPLAITLARNINARIAVTATMSKGQGNRYTVTARLAGVNDDAGYVATLSQKGAESLEDFGQRIAEALEPAIESLKDARACVEQREQKADKAAGAATKALKKVPNHGLAEFCLYQLALARKAPRQEQVQHLEAAVKGDPLSLPAWLALAGQYQSANDTAKTLEAFKQLLRVAPTNQKLREEIFRYFLQSGHPELALQVADEGLKIDPYNADLYDLKSNACLFQSNFRCAIDALEAMYAVDSTKADTLFFTKILVAASEGEAPDTTRLLKWAEIGAKKYPENLTILGYLNRAYVTTGAVDSSIAITRRLMTKDTTQVGPALASVQALAKAGRMTEVAPFADYVKRYGEPQQREQLALIYVNAALAKLQPDTLTGQKRDLPAAAELARQAIPLADNTGKVWPSAQYVLGLATFFNAAEMDAETEKQKSCDMARREQSLLQEAEAALTRGRSAKPELVDQYLGYIKKFNPRIKAMLKAYCK